MRQEIAKMGTTRRMWLANSLSNVGKIENGVVSRRAAYGPMSRSTIRWKSSPTRAACYFPAGKKDAAFRTKPKMALQLVQRAKEQAWPFRAVVADSLYGEDRGLRTGLRQMQVPSVLAPESCPCVVAS
jgi:SRSO17 transposase